MPHGYDPRGVSLKKQVGPKGVVEIEIHNFITYMYWEGSYNFTHWWTGLGD